MIRALKPKDKINFIDYCLRYSRCKDFYITENGTRLFLNDVNVCLRVYSNSIKNNGICYVLDDNGLIRGLLLILKNSETPAKHYLKIAAGNYKDVQKLFYFLNGHMPKKLFLQVNRQNIIHKLARKFKFQPVTSDKNEVLLCKTLNLYRGSTYNGKRNNR